MPNSMKCPVGPRTLHTLRFDLAEIDRKLSRAAEDDISREEAEGLRKEREILARSLSAWTE